MRICTDDCESMKHLLTLILTIMIFVVELSFKNLTAPNSTKPVKIRFNCVCADNLEHLKSVMADKVITERIEFTSGYDNATRKLREYEGISFATRLDGTSIGNTINSL